MKIRIASYTSQTFSLEATRTSFGLFMCGMMTIIMTGMTPLGFIS
ncbi:MAG: hypothetical protein WCS34_01775 [Bacteroidales bacterium]